MKRKTKPPIIIFLLALLAWGLNSAFEPESVITKEQAIILAEQFIAANGYTKTPADTSKISYELFDQYENNIDSILKRRYNTLQPEAFCISEDPGRWDVGFLSTTVDLGQLDSAQRLTNLPGRAVIVMKNGQSTRMAHKEPNFSFFEKLVK